MTSRRAPYLKRMESDQPKGEPETPSVTRSIVINVSDDGNLSLEMNNITAANLWAASDMLRLHGDMAYTEFLMRQAQTQGLQLARSIPADHLPRTRN